MPSEEGKAGDVFIGECDSCGYEPVKCTKSVPMAFNRSKGDLVSMCDICRGTLAGNAHQFPSQYHDSNSLKTIAWVGNHLAALIAQSANRGEGER